MKKLEATLSKFLLPVAAKLEENKPLAAVRRGMMTLIPVTLVGSIPILFNQLPNFPGLPEGIKGALLSISNITGPINLATFGFLSIYVAAFVGWYYSKERDVWDIGATLTAIMAFVTVAGLTTEAGTPDISYFGGSGIFTAIIVSLISVEILYIFRHKLKFTINLGDGVPTPIKRSFENLWPILFSIVIIALLKFGLETVFNTPVVKLVETLFSPLTGLVNTLPGILLILFLQQLLWWFGIHGYSVMAPLWLGVAFQNADANAAMLQAGTAMSEMFIFTPDFMWNLAGLTGSGLTGCLCILALRSKSKRYNGIGKMSAIPTLFGIGEPQLFGIPVVLNPMMFIPFILSSPIAAVIGWFAIDSGFMNPFVLVSPYIPLPFGALAACMDVKYLLVAAVIMVVITALYYPFFKIVEKQALEQEEQAEAKGQESLDDLEFDLDF